MCTACCVHWITQQWLNEFTWNMIIENFMNNCLGHLNLDLDQTISVAKPNLSSASTMHIHTSCISKTSFSPMGWINIHTYTWHYFQVNFFMTAKCFHSYYIHEEVLYTVKISSSPSYSIWVYRSSLPPHTSQLNSHQPQTTNQISYILPWANITGH